MVNQLTAVSLLELLIGGVAVAVAYVAWGYRRRPAGFPLFVVAVGTAGMAIANGLHTLIDDLVLTLVVRHAVFPFAATTAVGWFFLSVEYTNRASLKRPGALRLAMGFVVLDLLAVATNPLHHLFTTRASTVSAQGVFEPAYGPLFWLHSLVAFGLVSVGLAFLLLEFLRVRGIYRTQAGVVSAAGFVGVGFVLYQVLGPELIPGFAIGTIGLTVMSGMLLWAIFRADFLQTIPIARQTLMESMDAAFVAINDAGRVIDLNPASERLLDIDDGAIGRPAASVFESYPDLVARLEHAEETHTELSIERDGEVSHCALTISPVVNRAVAGDGDGAESVVGHILLVHDITDRKRRAERLERQNDRLDEFAGIVSHDLRNPLGVAHGNVQLVREECESEQLDAAAQALDRIGLLIDDLLTLAREGKPVSDIEPIDLGTITRASWEQVDTADAALVTTTDRVIVADASRVRQLLENLIRNAVEHGGDEVTVTVGGNESGFFVEDDGPGIPDEERDRVFERGYSTTDGGTGFGLSIVGQIAEAHDWTVSVREGTDGGARFEIAGVETS